jgi:zinc transport system permease protein
MTAALESLFRSLATEAFTYSDIKAMLAIVLVSLVCGLVSPLVVGSRMAFFSDAMAHTAIAGAALGVLVIVLAINPGNTLAADEYQWVVSLAMVGFGAAVGAGIAYFREKSGLTSDTVIGVFFALSIGFAAMILPELARVVKFDAERFLFGSPLYATEADILALVGVVILSVGFLALRYNAIVFASFNPSLARSRGLGVRRDAYLFIILLSLIVNLSIQAVGVLLINALLVVPAAAAANVAGNLRQMFKISLVSALVAGLFGYLMCWRYAVQLGPTTIHLRPGGTIVVMIVAWFFVTALFARLRGRAVAGADCAC